MQKYNLNTQVVAKQLAASISHQQDILKAAELYISAGFCLVPLLFGEKVPALKGWNKRTNTIADHNQIAHLTGRNIGLAHAYSGTCTIDVDDFTKTVQYFKDNGIDLRSLLTAPDTVQIKSGRDNRAKLLYRTDEVLSTFKHNDGGKTIVEFRCATANGLTVQDVLPPSIHPETGKPYTWQGNWQNLPALPAEMRDFWLQHSITQKPSPAVNEEKPHRKNIFSVGDTIFTMGERQETPLLDHINSTSEVAELYQTETIQRRLLDHLSFTEYEGLFKNGSVSVRSIVLPYDKNKSGGLIFSSRGEIMFHDYSGAMGQAHLTLPALYASLKTGFFFNLKATRDKETGTICGKVTPAVWAVRLLIDAGIVKPAEVLLPPCPDLRKSVKQFYAGVKLLFQVRWAFKDHKNGPVPMGRNFMSAWTGLSEDQCRDSIIALLKVGVIYTAGQHGRARLFAPGPGYSSAS